jgi:hypothetical protein
MPCPNCGDRRTGSYCPECGQRRIDRRHSLRRLIRDVVEDELSLSGALPRTVSTLLRPGRLARDYFDGRIARYIPPFRLYLISSFIYFLVLSLGRGGGDSAVQGWVSASDTAEVRAPVSADGRMPTMNQRVTREQVDSTFANVPLLTPSMRESLAGRAYRMSQLRPGELDRILTREFLARAPIAVFLLVPAFAALLALLYHRARRYYVEHFVFSLQLHAFAFLIFTLLQLIGWLPLARPALWAWLLFYIYSALRVVYGQARGRTALKFALLATSYGVLLGLALLGTLLITLALLPV